MNTQTALRLRIAGSILFLTGMLLGLGILTATVWGDMEGTLQDPTISVDEPLSTLRCPVLISTQETGLVTASIRNNTQYQVHPLVRMIVSRGQIAVTDRQEAYITIDPGGTYPMQWSVTSNEAVWKRLIFFRVDQSSDPPLPGRGASCGILVLNLGPFTGNQVVIATLVLSGLGMVLGIAMWLRSTPAVMDKRRFLVSAMITLGLLIGLGITINMVTGSWGIPGLLLIASLLLIVSTMGFQVAGG